LGVKSISIARPDGLRSSIDAPLAAIEEREAEPDLIAHKQALGE
jgi:hypothetical protein